MMSTGTSAVSSSMVISDGGAVDNWSQLVERSGSNSSSLSSSGLKSSMLSGSLVEPSSDVFLPVLSKVDVGDDVVVFDHISQK